MTEHTEQLIIKDLKIHTYKEAVIYMRTDCPVCRAEGFDTHARVGVTLRDRFIFATLNTVDSDILAPGEVSLSHYAMQLLHAKAGDAVTLSHPPPLHSLSFLRAKIEGEHLTGHEISHIIEDITMGRYADIHIAAFLSACAGGRLNIDEMGDMTQSMVDVGERLTWSKPMIVDKHSVGGVPGNRTTLIVVPIIASFGLTMPKTSSRAITSPSGSADTMEVMAPVNLSLTDMRRVVDQEGGCIIWGGAVSLSPADDILIRVERVLALDSEGQIVSSVLSKKIAAGSTHVVIDMPVGATAKIRDTKTKLSVEHAMKTVAARFNLKLKIVESSGIQPIGFGVGPALEAIDVLAVLQNKADAPADLREHALRLAAEIIEFSPKVKAGEGYHIAETILKDGRAWQKFQAICAAQGGFSEPIAGIHTFTINSRAPGQITHMNNHHITRIAHLAGAPFAKGAGVRLHVKIGALVDKGQPLMTIYAESKGELHYAIQALHKGKSPIGMEYHV